MIKCSSCGRENPDYCIFCQGCNTLLSSINSDGSLKDSGSSASSPAPQIPVSYKREEPRTETTEPPVKQNYSSPNIPKEIYSPDHGEYIYRGPKN